MLINDLKFHIRSLSRFVYVVTEEEDRFLQLLKGFLGAQHLKRVQVYNAAFGLIPLEQLMTDWKSREHKEQPDSNINNALIKAYRDDPSNELNIYVITDPDRWLKDEQVVRRVLNLAHQMRANDGIIKIVFFVGPRLLIPQKLQRYIEVIHDKGLSTEDIQTLLTEFSQKTNMPIGESLVNSFKGLTAYEVEAAVAQSIIKTKKAMDKAKRVDPKFIQEYKRRQLSKTDLINYVDVTDSGFEQVGGLDSFKAWAEKQKAAWTPEGQKFGLVPPKGVLLMGVWGCGKSISAKALGNAWKLPVIQLEMGKLKQSGVGDSESNTYRVISLIESVGNCIVWVDEAEKSLAGGQSSAMSDAGTTSRMIGILSTWLQETKIQACLVMTVNSLKTLPIEFVRRMDERFFFDLPAEEERVDILKIHLTRKRQDPSNFNLANLAEDANLMVGSEIEQAIKSAMIESFHASEPGLSEAILSQELKKKPRIFNTLTEELKEILDWVGYDANLEEGIRAKFASSRKGAAFRTILGGSK